jgi:type VI secretion system protein ImpJ
MQKVLWTKGVLLAPQHLQLQDLYLEDLVGFQLASLTYAPWGFSRLALDQEALGGGSFQVSEAAGLMPDGLAFEIPGSDPAPAPRPLDEHWGPDQKSMVVHLAIPEHRPNSYNVSVSQADRHTRYLAEVAMRRDENTGLAEKPIQLARKNIRLVLEGEPLDDHVALPVARITRSAAGLFELDSQFVPPILHIGASSYLQSLARRATEVLVARSSGLAGARRQRGQGLADFGVSDTANFWLLYTINTHLPHFRHLLETKGGHPEELYRAMAALASALTTFSETLHPRDIPAYDHARLGQCFARLNALLHQLLETVVPANHATLPLRPAGPSIYATAIDQDRYLAAPQIFLAVAADTPRDELIRKVPNLLKVSSGDQIDRLIKQALSGVTLRHVSSPPSALPTKLDFQYFAIERGGPEWDAIRLARNLAAYVPVDFVDPRLELVILLPAAQKGH